MKAVDEQLFLLHMKIISEDIKELKDIAKDTLHVSADHDIRLVKLESASPLTAKSSSVVGLLGGFFGGLLSGFIGGKAGGQ